MRPGTENATNRKLCVIGLAVDKRNNSVGNEVIIHSPVVVIRIVEITSRLHAHAARYKLSNIKLDTVSVVNHLDYLVNWHTWLRRRVCHVWYSGIIVWVNHLVEIRRIRIDTTVLLVTSPYY